MSVKTFNDRQFFNPFTGGLTNTKVHGGTSDFWDSIDSATIEANLAKSQYDYQFDKENAYNSPQSQMERLKLAGLNPNLVYNSGNAIMASSSPNMGHANVNFDPAASRNSVTNGFSNILGSIGGIVSGVQNMRLANAQIDSINANTQKTLAEIPGVALTQEGQRLKNDYQSTLNDVYKVQSDELKKQPGLSNQHVEAQIDQLGSQTALNDANTLNSYKDIEVKDSNIALNDSQMNYYDAMTEKVKLDKDITEEQRDARMSILNLEKAIKQMNLKEAQEILKTYPQKIANLEKDGQLKDIQLMIETIAKDQTAFDLFNDIMGISDDSSPLTNVIHSYRRTGIMGHGYNRYRESLIKKYFNHYNGRY